MSSPSVSVEIPQRHLNGVPKDWFAVRVRGEIVVVNEAGEGSVTAYELGKPTRNPRVVAASDAVLWNSIVALTNYDDEYGTVSFSHRFGGIEKRQPVSEWLDEPVHTLERTELVSLEGYDE